MSHRGVGNLVYSLWI